MWCPTTSPRASEARGPASCPCSPSSRRPCCPADRRCTEEDTLGEGGREGGRGEAQGQWWTLIWGAGNYKVKQKQKSMEFVFNSLPRTMANGGGKEGGRERARGSQRGRTPTYRAACRRRGTALESLQRVAAGWVCRVRPSCLCVCIDCQKTCTVDEDFPGGGGTQTVPRWLLMLLCTFFLF